MSKIFHWLCFLLMLVAASVIAGGVLAVICFFLGSLCFNSR